MLRCCVVSPKSPLWRSLDVAELKIIHSIVEANHKGVAVWGEDRLSFAIKPELYVNVPMPAAVFD
jgi:hypothetical protein